MINFCTLFNTNYLSRGLALYQSLLDHCPSFTLYIFAFDDKTLEILEELQLKNVVTISLKDFEDEELLKVKPTRSLGEYCWTCTPSTIKYCLDTFGLNSCTYLDADLYFYSDPDPIFKEFHDHGGDVLITEHRYTKYYDQSEDSGIYCVQFMTFKNNANAYIILDWWRNACLEWCYARAEEGKFGDQKYLDDWTQRFSGVCVLQHLGAGVAPWNVQQYSISSQEHRLSLSLGGFALPVIFYHFHDLKLYKNADTNMGSYYLSSHVKEYLYKPYLEALNVARLKIGEVDPEVDPHGSLVYKQSLRNVLRHLKSAVRNFWVRLNV